MLLRLSRLSFWFAAGVAALALLAPGGRETLLTAVAGLSSLLALGLWRSALRGEQRRPAAALAPAPTPLLDESSLLETGALLVRRAHEAGSFEAALHAVAQLLRCELGALDTTVHEVLDVDATHAQLSDLVESQPGFRTVARRIRLDATPLAQALRSQAEAGAPPGAVALPVIRDRQVVAAIVLTGIELPVEAKALAGLLELARLTLSQIAQAARSTPVRPVSAPVTRRSATAGRRADDRARGLSAAGLPLRAAHSRRLTTPHATVLVVEDNVVQPELTARMLRRMGCRVTVASGMLDGLNLLCRTQFNLVLIDMQMSGVDGAEGLRRLRHNPDGIYRFMSASDIPVVALSVPGLPGEAERLRELGFDDHLFKPFRQSQMLAMLSKHLRPHVPAESNDAAVGGDAPQDLGGTAPPGLDAVALARLSELDPKGENRLLERVLRAFQVSVARLRPQLETAQRSGDRASIRLVAHTLKSSSASIGALQLSQLCAQIEAQIRLDSADDLGGPLRALSDALDAALQAIDTVLKERVR
jgi:CheY-like chemotaxis protein/HPt (histidine-containing phosphotransfer) domain-containing protein